MIYSYPDTLLEKWIIYCEGLLSTKLDSVSNDLNDLLGTTGSDNPSRAKEMMNVGFLKLPISTGNAAFDSLRGDVAIQSEFGYIAYLIAKAKLEDPDGLEKSFAALCSVALVQQYEELNGVKISLSSILIRLITLFPIPHDVEDASYLRYLSAAMFCELKLNKEKFFRSITEGSRPKLRIIEKKTERFRAVFNSPEDIEAAINDSVSLTGIVYEKGSTYFIGNYRDASPRGIFYIAYVFFKEFLFEYSEVEFQRTDDNIFASLYCDEQYAEVIAVIRTTLTGHNKIEGIKVVMISLENGCKQALRALSWAEDEVLIHGAGGQNKIFFGAPGTGKSYRMDLQISGVDSSNVERVTFHPEYDYASFVGCYKPVMEYSTETSTEEIKYRFVPQAFLKIYAKAWNDLSNSYFFVIEEINRGNCAEIFGDIFQLLDRDANYSISPSLEILEYLKGVITDPNTSGISEEKLMLPPNLNILATMNTSDQSLMPMDSAFKRRWLWEYVPICYEAKYESGIENTSYIFQIEVNAENKYSWIDFIKKVNEVIKENPHLGMDKCIGNYFVKPAENIISIDEFINKVIFYLWSDVFKDEEETIFSDGVMYEDFFPVSSNGANRIMKLLDDLEVNRAE